MATDDGLAIGHLLLGVLEAGALIGVTVGAGSQLTAAQQAVVEVMRQKSAVKGWPPWAMVEWSLLGPVVLLPGGEAGRYRLCAGLCLGTFKVRASSSRARRTTSLAVGAQLARSRSAARRGLGASSCMTDFRMMLSRSLTCWDAGRGGRNCMVMGYPRGQS